MVCGHLPASPSEFPEIKVVAGDSKVLNNVCDDTARNIACMPRECNEAFWVEWIGKVTVTASGANVFAADFLESTFQLPTVP